MSVIFQKLVLLRQNLTCRIEKIIKKNCESKKTNDNMKYIFEKYMSPEK